MALFENMRTETVSRLTLREPVLAKPDHTVRQAVQKMREAHLGCVIVIDADQRPIGMFTESMLTGILANSPSALDDPLSAHTVADWPQVSMSTPVEEVLTQLETRNVRFLSVVDENGKVVGLTGQKGLMEYVAEHFPGQVMVQRIGQKPYLHSREGA